ncbi:geranylgeranylglycerol-phosphate geranylgeranyltransferase [bacterium]|nr:geranylgeranylglycerol-phosphate geranylgeranyltransferase [bacterium]
MKPSNLAGLFLLMRPLNVLIAFLSIFIGGLITGTIHPLKKLLLACLSGSIIAAGANSINDYFDLEIDRINKPQRPLPLGRITKAQAWGFSMVCFLTGIAVSTGIHATGFAIALLSSIVLYVYSWKLKGTVIWGNLTVAFITGLAFVYGGLALGRIRQSLVLGVFSFFFNFAREVIKDIEDQAGDRSNGMMTFPIRYGNRPSLLLATLTMAVLVVLTVLPYLFGWFPIRYLIAIVLGVDLFLFYVVTEMWRDSSPQKMGRLSFWMKVDMFMGLLAIYIGS